MTIKCNCGEQDATWKGSPTAEFQKEYPDEDWYFCDECMEKLFGGMWTGGGPFSSDFISFSRLDVNDESTKTTKSIDAIIDSRDDDFVFDELTGEIADEICRRHVKRDPESEKHEDIKDIIRDRIIAYRDGKPLEFGDGREID